MNVLVTWSSLCCREDEYVPNIFDKVHDPVITPLDEEPFESIHDKRCLIRRSLHAIKAHAADIEVIACKKTDLDYTVATVLLKVLKAVYEVLKRYAQVYHHEPFDIYKYWAKERYSPYVVEMRKHEIGLYLASIQQVCWQLEYKFIRHCVYVGQLNVCIKLTRRCIDLFQKFFNKFNPRACRQLWKVKTVSVGKTFFVVG